VENKNNADKMIRMFIKYKNTYELKYKLNIFGL
jgi:hypothetical protein